MFRKRERFERSDVPRESPYTNVIGLAVITIVAVLVGIVVVTIWDRAQLESHLGDHGLNKAVKARASQAILMALHNLMMTFLPMPLSAQIRLRQGSQRFSLCNFWSLIARREPAI